MVHLNLQEIPAKHILKRWSRDARDILPPKFLRYQKDQGLPKYSSRRHNTLFLLALEIVKLGDSNVDAYTLAMEKMTEVKVMVEPVVVVWDWLVETWLQILMVLE